MDGTMGTILVGMIVFAIIALAAWRVYKNMKSGKGCSCPSSGTCAGCARKNPHQ